VISGPVGIGEMQIDVISAENGRAIHKVLKDALKQQKEEQMEQAVLDGQREEKHAKESEAKAEVARRDFAKAKAEAAEYARSSEQSKEKAYITSVGIQEEKNT